ncbi:trigger factor-like protein TIG, Chloroplastic isoform X2 [Physcomitrium patens]|uniref:peptidylprolyl isomerase n=1 Tax=Physcomitrium patens TaxID=3218 RepID=A0A2K1JUA4_PHYPA|nr:trigger factor-like protein TIG, Chloroplastic isoform X2 [Physcomitrium patens]PNR45108.1 hypothetical protein PHYPA_014879 [Physcomitrium patens]|eukprot:XP_024388971.1 trigger factor-like protein TIG, Chloroplastic isoform X2 [Physcomitrella patens]
MAMAVAHAHTATSQLSSVCTKSSSSPSLSRASRGVHFVLPLSSPSAGVSSELKKSRRFQQGAGNGFNLVAVFKYPQQDHRRRRGEAVVVRAGEVAVKEESGTPSLGLEVVETNLANSRVQLKVHVPVSVCKDCYDQVLKEFGKQSKVPGFRPGKNIPENVLINFIGQDQIRSSAVEAVLKRTLPEAMSSVAGRAIKDSEHISTKFADLAAGFAPDKPLSYDVAVDVAPEIKWNPENGYKNLKVTVECEADDALAAQKAADAELLSRLKDLGSLRVVIGRGLEMGDVGVVDVSAVRLNEDGTTGDEILSCKQKGFRLDTDEGGSFLPGFVEALIGIQNDESRSFDLTFPPTWEQESLRGLQARFTVVGREIFIRQLPELNDELAPQLFQDCTSLAEIKEALLRKHTELIERAKKTATQFAITTELAKVAEIDVPNSLLEEQGRQMYASKLIELQASMKLSKEQVVALSSAEMVHNYLIAQKPRITESVKQSLAVAEIYKLENLEISEEELQAEVDSAIEEFKRFDQEYEVVRVKEQARELLEGSKVLDWLTEHADITYVPKQS